jgi:hypothetical protein
MGCGGPGIDHDVEHLVTIAQGVYGQAYELSDICESGGCPEWAVPGLEFTVSGPMLAAPRTTRSGGPLGFWELALPAGDFTLCTTNEDCTSVSISPGELERWDRVFTFGPPWAHPGGS